MKKESLKSPISKVYEIAQKMKIDVSFEIIKERGKDHKKIFVMQAKLGHVSVTAEGKSKKEAKKAAAELILERVNELGVSKDDYSILLKNKNNIKKKNKQKNKVMVSLKPGWFFLIMMEKFL